ncbi:MAG: hypothetical protein ACRDHZ_00210 [Ktedonobacteraceae bacterium]
MCKRTEKDGAVFSANQACCKGCAAKYHHNWRKKTLHLMALMLISFVFAVPVLAQASPPLKIEGLIKIDKAKKKHWWQPRKKQYHYKLETKPGAPFELVTTKKIANAPDLRPIAEQHPWKSKEGWADRRDRAAVFGNKYSGLFSIGGSCVGAATTAGIYALRVK